jgi:hypothetical protein
MDLMFQNRGKVMRLIIVLLASALMSVMSGQEPRAYDSVLNDSARTARQLTAAEFRLITVERLLNSGSPLKIGLVQLHRMGDDVAVNLIKLRATLGKLTLSQTSTALDMIERAFERSSSITSALDRTPRATVSLLRDLAALPETSETAKERIGVLLQRFEPMIVSEPNGK